ncbi:MAG: efflux RND transporter periplasmic adaptor subunit [Acidobacteriaceae bacterium]
MLATGCAKQKAAPAIVVQVQVAEVTKQAISQHVAGDAVLAPIVQAAISPKITAPVRKFYVMRGSKVKQGELLAVLENKDLSAVALDNKGSYEQAQAAYNTATKASIPEIYQKAVLDTEQAKANLDVAQKVYDSRNMLFKQGAIPGRELNMAKASLVQAQSAYDIAKTHLASTKAISRADALKSAAGQLVSAKAKYEAADAQLGYSEIRSPINGVVTDRSLFAGETAPAGTPLITVMDISTLLAKAHLPQDQARLLKVGQGASVHVDGMDQPVAGTVSLISPALDPGSTTIEVWVKVPNKEGKLKVGTPAIVSIMSKAIPNALVVPKEAVITNPAGTRIVMVVDANSVAHQREIKTGITDGNEVQVIGGLRAGEKVVTSGAYAMDDGTKVAVVPPGGSGSGANKPGGGI